MNEDPERASRLLVAALVLTATLNPLNSTMIAVALPAIAVAFGVTGGVVTTGLVTTYLIVNIVAVSPAGGLADRIGRRRALGLGQSLLAAGAIVGGLNPRLEGVIAGRILMAAGGAIVIPTAMAVLRGAFPPDRRARVFASFGALMGLSAAVGPVIGGVLTARVGWQAIFLVNAPILVVAWLMARGAPKPAADPATSAQARGFDGIGTGLLVIGLAAVAVGLKVGPWRWGLIALGSLALLAFVIWEGRAVDPLLDLRLFRERHFVAGGFVIALQNLSMYALIFQLPFLLEGSLDFGPERVGQVLLTMTLAMMITAPIGGRVSEHIGIRHTVLIGLGVGTFGLLLGQRGVEVGSLGLLLIFLAALGVSLGFVMGPVQAAALSAVPILKSGIASGVLSTMRYFGGIFGVLAISVLLDRGDGAADALAGHRACLWIYLAAHGIALVVATLLPTQPKVDRGPPNESGHLRRA